MILLELRWMLAPGDAEEVIKRVRICGEKIDQLRRKVLAARDHFVELTQILKLGDPSGWSVSGIVVIDGFAGAPPQTGFDIPLVPQPVFLAALRNLGEGRYLHQYFASGCWLPEEGRDYLLESRSQFLLGSHIRETHFSPGPKGYFEETIAQNGRELRIDRLMWDAAHEPARSAACIIASLQRTHLPPEA